MSLEFPELPLPEIIDQSTYEQILTRLLDQFRLLAPDYENLVEGDPVYMLAQAAAYSEFNVRQQINNAYRQTIVLYASGTNLDNLVSNINLTRQVKEEAVYDDNGVLETPAVLETDLQLRRRYILAWHALGSGTFGWYKFHALNADVKVKDAYPKRTADGEVTVYIQAEGDDPVPDSALLTDVETYMNALDRRIACDTLVIAAVTKVEYQITAALTISAQLDETETLADVTAAIEDFAAEMEVIDEDIPISRIYSVLGPDGIEAVELTSPTANITTNDNEVPVATTITITAA